MAAEITGLVTQTQDQGSAATAPASIGVPYDIRASVDTMTMYLLTKDKIDRIKAGVASEESTMFGVAIGVFTAVGSVLAPLYISGDADKAGKLIPFLWAALFAFGALSVYWGIKWRRVRKQSEATVQNILDTSKTVVIQPSQK